MEYCRKFKFFQSESQSDKNKSWKPFFIDNQNRFKKEKKIIRQEIETGTSSSFLTGKSFFGHE